MTIVTNPPRSFFKMALDYGLSLLRTCRRFAGRSAACVELLTRLAGIQEYLGNAQVHPPLPGIFILIPVVYISC